MNEVKYLETKDKKYPFIYSLNVMNAIQNKYGSLQEWGELVEPKNGKEPNIEAIIFYFKEAINEGIDIENENATEKMDFVSEKKVGRIISEVGMKEATTKLKNSVTSDEDNQNVEKNV